MERGAYKMFVCNMSKMYVCNMKSSNIQESTVAVNRKKDTEIW